MKKRSHNKSFHAKKKRGYKKNRKAYLRKKLKRKDYESLSLNLLKKYPPPIISYRPIKKKTKDIQIPLTFSIIDNPKIALSPIFDLASLSKFDKFNTIFIDHSKLKEVDLAAESILDSAVIEVMKERRSSRKKIKVGGILPVNEDLKRYIKAVGIIKNLEVKHKYLPKDVEKDLRIFSMRSSLRQNDAVTGSLDKKSKAAKDFSDHINDCLNDNGRRLTPKARQLLLVYVGEILANAEEHSMLDDWHIVGYLDNINDPHICEIAIFNYGKTYSESFRDLSNDAYAFQVIKPYIDAHKKAGLFSSGWDIDDLLTLVALQGSISSKNMDKSGTRGQGTVELIEFFMKVHKECISDGLSCAKMAILSGSTHMLFDGKYKMELDSQNRKIIAFNKNNDLNMPPDNNYIKNLSPYSFPGTIISIRFPMQNSHTVGADNNV